MRVISFLLSGLVVGALGRLAVPGRQPLGCILTIAVGVGGSLLGGVVGQALFGPDYAPGLVMSVLGAATLVWLLTLLRPTRW